MGIDYGPAMGDRCHTEGYAWGQALLRAVGVSFFCLTIFPFSDFVLSIIILSLCSSSLFLPAFLLSSLHIPIF